MQKTLRLAKQQHAREFVFTTTEYECLDKYDGGSEFCLNGNMYDVISSKTQNGQVVLLAFFDHRETTLLSRFIAMFSTDSDQEDTPSPNSQLRNIYEFYWLSYQFFFQAPVRFFSRCQTTLTFISYIVQPNSPPPDLL